MTLLEGSTPLVPAERLSERVGADVWLKVEGANPTGSFKDRGMTCAASAALRDGAEAVICAPTGTPRPAGGVRRRARPDRRGDRAEGKIARACPGAHARGAGDRAARELRRRPRRACAKPRRAPPDRAGELGQPVPARGAEDRGVRGPRRDRRDRRALHPGRQRGQHHRVLEGLQEAGAAPRMLGWQAEGAAPLVEGAPVENPETVASAIRIGNPARWEEAMGR